MVFEVWMFSSAASVQADFSCGGLFQGKVSSEFG